MTKPKELFVWANPDKTISVSLGTIETEVKMTLEEAKEKFSNESVQRKKCINNKRVGRERVSPYWSW